MTFYKYCFAPKNKCHSERRCHLIKTCVYVGYKCTVHM